MKVIPEKRPHLSLQSFLLQSYILASLFVRHFIAPVMSDSESTEDDFEEVMFAVQEIELDVAVKVLIVLIWLLIETVGNGLLFGLIHYDLWAGDPLKRRISDQVG